MIRLHLFLLAFMFPAVLSAQNPDSLEKALVKVNDPHEKADLLVKTSFAFLFSSPEKCDQYSAEAILLSKSHNFKSELAKAYRIRGVLFMEALDKYEISELYLDSALSVFTELKDTFGIAKTLNNMGAMNYYQSRRTEASVFYNKALELFTAIHNDDEAANVLFNMANMVMEAGNYDSARMYYTNFLKISLKTGNINGEAIAHINIGHTYFETGKFDAALAEFMKGNTLSEKAGNLLYQVQALTFAAHIFKTTGFKDKAVSFYYKAYDVASKAQNKSIQANAIMSLANLYMESSMKDSAMYLVDKAYKIYEAANDIRGMATTVRFKGDYYREMKQPAVALDYFLKAMSYAPAMEYEIFKGNLLHLIAFCYLDLSKMPEAQRPDSLKSKSLLIGRSVYYFEDALTLAQQNKILVLQKNIHKELADIYQDQGKFKEALLHHRKFVELKDSIFSEESTMKIAKLETKHDLEMKQKELALQKLELESATKDKWIMGAGSVLFLTAGGYYIYRYRRQQKAKLGNELEKVRGRISRDLHDEVGSTLTAIQFLSKSANKKLSQNETEKAAVSIEKMQENARQVQEIMSDIVWNVKPESDKLSSIILRMTEYSATTFDTKNIQFSFYSESEDENLMLDPELKNNIYRIYKEAVNNCAKYSDCTMATASLKVKENDLELILKDNGSGIPEAVLQGINAGNGLSNMRKRAAESHGRLDIVTSSEGTTIKFTCKITSSGDWISDSKDPKFTA